jgi:hypothetical protein
LTVPENVEKELDDDADGVVDDDELSSDADDVIGVPPGSSERGSPLLGVIVSSS